MRFGVLLAAGTSERFGEENKLLATVEGRPLVAHAGATLAAATDDAVAVIGHEADRVSAALADVPIETVRNPDYAAGQGTSVAVGARVARERGADAVAFALGDVPDVRESTYDALFDVVEEGAPAAVPTVEGRRGNPVVFAAGALSALASLDGDAGGRTLFDRFPPVRIPVDDPGVLRDVDTPTDLDVRRSEDRHD